MRHNPSGLRANTTEAACPAVECWIQPRSSRSLPIAGLEEPGPRAAARVR